MGTFGSRSTGGRGRYLTEVWCFMGRSGACLCVAIPPFRDRRDDVPARTVARCRTGGAGAARGVGPNDGSRDGATLTQSPAVARPASHAGRGASRPHFSWLRSPSWRWRWSWSACRSRIRTAGRMCGCRCAMPRLTCGGGRGCSCRSSSAWPGCTTCWPRPRCGPPPGRGCGCGRPRWPSSRRPPPTGWHRRAWARLRSTFATCAPADLPAGQRQPRWPYWACSGPSPTGCCCWSSCAPACGRERAAGPTNCPPSGRGSRGSPAGSVAGPHPASRWPRWPRWPRWRGWRGWSRWSRPQARGRCLSCAAARAEPRLPPRLLMPPGTSRRLSGAPGTWLCCWPPRPGRPSCWGWRSPCASPA